MAPAIDPSEAAERAFRDARAVEDAGDPLAAEAAYRTVLARFPGDVRAANNLGMLLEARGLSDEAAALFHAALERDPDALPVLMNLGALEHARGRRDAAGALYRRVLAADPDALPATMNLARLHFDRAEFAEATALLERAATQAPDEPAVQTALGTVLFERGLPAEALARFELALRLAPQDAEKHFHVARALDALERTAEAIRSYRDSLALDARSVVARERLARLLVVSGRREEAVAMMRRWLEEVPGQPVATHFLASIGADPAPARAADAYVRMVFDRFADDFDTTLGRLHYRAPQLVVEALQALAGEPRGDADVLDAGCGTGLCGPLLRPWARRLVGVDLSFGMLARAAGRGYDLLAQAELTAFLAGRPAAWDLVASADTLVYFGDLRDVLRAAASALRRGGGLVFTLEREEPGEAGAPYALQIHGRYRHRADYVEAAVREAGLKLLALSPVTPRWEAGQPVAGLLVCAAKG